MDTFKDKQLLDDMYSKGNALWEIWKKNNNTGITWSRERYDVWKRIRLCWRLELNKKYNQSIKILCLGAHCDDIEIGCGGTLLSVLQKYKKVRSILGSFQFGFKERKGSESKRQCIFKIRANKKTIEINKFKNGFFPYDGGEIKKYFEILKEGFSPDLIFTHYRMDLHQDHERFQN